MKNQNYLPNQTKANYTLSLTTFNSAHETSRIYLPLMSSFYLPAFRPKPIYKNKFSLV